VRNINYYYQKKTLLSEKQLELSTISDLKIRQITQWRKERVGDGEFLRENRLMVKMISRFLVAPTVSLRESILLTISSLTENYDYKNVTLLDNKGTYILSYPEPDSSPDDLLMPVLSEIIKSREVVITDLHQTELTGSVHLELVIPILDYAMNDTSVLGFLNLRIDPEKVLYPLIQSWPNTSRSAESFIFRREGDDIVYLSGLRHLKNTGLTFRKPVALSTLPASMALNGMSSTIDGIDYRNVPVVASIKKIPGMTWYMVAKVDREEVFEDLKGQMEMVVIILVLFIISIGFFLGFFWWNQRVRFYREKYETEVSRMALVKHFDYILKFANDIILLIDKNLNIVEANDRALETYMYTRDEFIGMKLEKIRAAEAIPQLSEQLRNINENDSATFETLHKRKDNSTFPVEISARLVTIEESRYYQTIGRDITERKSVENTLKESEEKFRKIFEESPFCMLMSGKDFSILRANSSFCKMIGYHEEELKSFTFRNFTHPDNLSNDEISLMKLISGEIPVYNTEKRYIRKDGSIILGLTTVSLVHNNKGEVQYFLAMVEDITLRKKSEADLIAAKEKAEESDRLKTAFLHNVSHEIRTPMNSIIGFSSLISETDLSENERKQYSDIIFQSSNQLLSIINDIVDIANIESGQVILNLSEINLNAQLISLKDQFSYKEKENNILIVLSNGLADEESVIVTDNTKLIQILSNLINNSIKFTKQGTIEFGYVVMENFLEFFVNDTGIGISTDQIDKIFDRFYQVDDADSRIYGGTGLGLSICKAYVELLGGRINASSNKGKGTEFRFTVPWSK